MPRSSPRKDESEKFSSAINLKLTRDLKAQLDATAIAENVSVQRLLREGAEARVSEARVNVGAVEVKSSQIIKEVPLLMSVPCGIPQDLSELFENMEECRRIEVTDELAECVTPHSYAVQANGWSMSDGAQAEGILSGDWVLLTPIEEFPRDVQNGDIVLVRLSHHDGTLLCTLKTWQDGRLEPRNPRFSTLTFGAEVERAEIWAVARGKVRQEVRFS